MIRERLGITGLEQEHSVMSHCTLFVFCWIQLQTRALEGVGGDSLVPHGFWDSYFPINFLVKWFSPSFDVVKWNFHQLLTTWENPLLPPHLEKKTPDARASNYSFSTICLLVIYEVIDCFLLRVEIRDAGAISPKLGPLYHICANPHRGVSSNVFFYATLDG